MGLHHCPVEESDNGKNALSSSPNSGMPGSCTFSSASLGLIHRSQVGPKTSAEDVRS